MSRRETHSVRTRALLLVLGFFAALSLFGAVGQAWSTPAAHADVVGNTGDGATSTSPTGSGAGGSFNLNTDHIMQLANGLEFYALLLCVAGIFISSALWAIGSKGQNPGQELTGKKGMILCCTAAFFIGAFPGILSSLEDMAGKADTTGVTGQAQSPSNGLPPAPCSLATQHTGVC